MSIVDAVSSVLRNYATFSGRARRSEFWWFALFETVLLGVLFALSLTVWKGFLVIYGLAILALIVPGIAVSVRRLHDTGRSGWWYLLGFVPLGGFVLLAFYCIGSDEGPNAYGPPPAEPDAVEPLAATA